MYMADTPPIGPMSRSCHPPFQALPTEKMVWLRGARLGTLFGAHGTYDTAPFSRHLKLTCRTQATVFNFPGLLVTRVCLGVFEAALSPGVPLYLCTVIYPPARVVTIYSLTYPFTALFYTRDEIGLRIAAYNGVAAVAGAFGGLVAFGIQNAHVGIPTWKLLFLVEGAPSVLLSLAAFTFLPNRPEETTIFNKQERKIVLERGSRRTKADVGRVLQRSTWSP